MTCMWLCRPKNLLSATWVVSVPSPSIWSLVQGRSPCESSKFHTSWTFEVCFLSESSELPSSSRNCFNMEESTFQQRAAPTLPLLLQNGPQLSLSSHCHPLPPLWHCLWVSIALLLKTQLCWIRTHFYAYALTEQTLKGPSPNVTLHYWQNEDNGKAFKDDGPMRQK